VAQPRAPPRRPDADGLCPRLRVARGTTSSPPHRPDADGDALGVGRLDADGDALGIGPAIWAYGTLYADGLALGV
jgi:hypothetical protein